MDWPFFTKKIKLMKNIFYFLFLSIVTTFIFLKVYGHPLSPTTVNKKTTICVIPLNGGVSKTQLDSSINYLQNTFPNTIITVGENIKLPKNCYNGRRYRADSILNFLNTLDIDSDKIIGLTSKDISVTRHLIKNGKKVTYPDFGIFGLARCPGKVCVISSYRLNKNIDMFAKTVVHEFMHTLGVGHCEHNFCIMQDGKGSGKNMKESNTIHHDCLRQANYSLNY